MERRVKYNLESIILKKKSIWHDYRAILKTKNRYQMKKLILLLITKVFCFTSIYSQATYNKIIWDKECNCPVQYATISNSSDYSITNEEGFFSLTTTEESAKFSMLGYESFQLDFKKIENDTIYVNSKPFELEEIVIDSDSYFTNMIKRIPIDYALQPHTEKFYLRAILKKNNEIIKVIDLSGKVRKETLFNTMSIPMPKNNYTIQVENIRKAGKIFRDYDFTIISFKNFFNLHNGFYISPNNFNIEYKSLKDSSYTKVLADQKKENISSYQKGYFLVNNKTKNFEQANIFTEFSGVFEKIDKELKNRTVFYEVTSDFKTNPLTDKLQINRCNIRIQVEVMHKDELDKFDLSFIYFADPIDTNPQIKNNINHSKDIFDLSFEHDANYWQSQEKLPLTTEMQAFINEVNASGKNSDFRTKTNIKE